MTKAAYGFFNKVLRKIQQKLLKRLQQRCQKGCSKSAQTATAAAAAEVSPTAKAAAASAQQVEGVGPIRPGNPLPRGPAYRSRNSNPYEHTYRNPNLTRCTRRAYLIGHSTERILSFPYCYLFCQHNLHRVRLPHTFKGKCIPEN
jgi:hypothetical protein